MYLLMAEPFYFLDKDALHQSCVWRAVLEPGPAAGGEGPDPRHAQRSDAAQVLAGLEVQSGAPVGALLPSPGLSCQGGAPCKLG